MPNPDTSMRFDHTIQIRSYYHPQYLHVIQSEDQNWNNYVQDQAHYQSKDDLIAALFANTRTSVLVAADANLRLPSGYIISLFGFTEINMKNHLSVKIELLDQDVTLEDRISIMHFNSEPRR